MHWFIYIVVKSNTAEYYISIKSLLGVYSAVMIIQRNVVPFMKKMWELNRIGLWSSFILLPGRAITGIPWALTMSLSSNVGASAGGGGSVVMETSNFAHVIFQNVGKSFLPQAALECHYTLTPFITPHPKDWVGIFKVGAHYLTHVYKKNCLWYIEI